MPENDPRIFFAAERTMLAWVRTGLGLVGMGFVVARFGLFLQLVRPDTKHLEHPWAGPLGIVLALLGAAASAVAAWQHRRFCRTLTPDELPRSYFVEPGLALGIGVAVVGVVLAVVLVV